MHADAITGQIARAALALTPAAIPRPVIDKARQLIGDMLMVAAAGQAQASSAAIIGALAPSQGRSRVWFGDRQRLCSAVDAVFINTLHAGALDFDSLNGAVHADLVTLPAAWAGAEHHGRSPQALLTAFVIASEVVSRLSRCALGVSKGWSGTSIYGGIGAALAYGLLMGLDEQRLQHALGLATIQAAGTQQANVEQTLAKRLQPAFAARNGVFAAQLAEVGASAPSQAVEGRFGLRALYQPGDDQPLLAGWGHEWQLLDTAVKRFPVCACSHAAIQALLDLQAQLGFSAEQAEEVVATISPFMSRLVGGAFSPHGDLQVIAQFNLRYHLASVLLRGPIRLEHLEPEALLDPRIQALVAKIHLKVDPDNHNELAPARVCVGLTGGQRHEALCTALPGSPQMPVSAQERLAKARACAAFAKPVLSDERLARLLTAIDRFEELPTLDALWSES